MAEAVATRRWEGERFHDCFDTHHLPGTLEGLSRLGDSPALIYLTEGTLALTIAGRTVFATAPSLVQITGVTTVGVAPCGRVSGKRWVFKSRYCAALCDVEPLTVTPFGAALEAAWIGGCPIPIAQTRQGVLAIGAAHRHYDEDWTLVERFYAAFGEASPDRPTGVLLWATRPHLSNNHASVDLAIIGAGPSGLSVAAWAQAANLTYRIFGEPLSFWKRHIAPLPLRSPPAATNISSPHAGYRFLDFAERHGVDAATPVSMGAFLAYAAWFSDAHGIAPIPSVIERVYPGSLRWSLYHSGGKTEATNVVVAVGLQGMQRRPSGLDAISPYWSYVSDALDYGHFSGQRIAVIGGGQSAIEAALLATRAGAEVSLLIRQQGIQYRCLHTPGEWLYRNLFKRSRHFMGHLPGPLQDSLLRYLLKGTVETSLEPVVHDSGIRIITQARVSARSELDARPAIFHQDGESNLVDHVLVAAGYDYDVHRIPFLESLPVRHRGGIPLLDRHVMSSLPGLFFSGMAAVRRFGPQAQFVFGTDIQSPRIIRGIERRRASVR